MGLWGLYPLGCLYCLDSENYDTLNTLQFPNVFSHWRPKIALANQDTDVQFRHVVLEVTIASEVLP